jgi:hypothetical protein
LEQAFVSFGVAPKQRDNARRAFVRSARIAGMFPTPAEDRLVEPVTASVSPHAFNMAAVEATPSEDDAPRTRAPAVVGNAVPPFMAWLIDALPAQGSDWDRQAQADWLQIVAQTFRVVYKAEAKETIAITVKGAAGE